MLKVHNYKKRKRYFTMLTREQKEAMLNQILEFMTAIAYDEPVENAPAPEKKPEKVKMLTVKECTEHTVRNATLLLNSGVDLKVVSDHLGHCDIGVTANIYADVLKSTKAKVADHVSLKLA